MNIPGYNISEKIYQSFRTSVFRAVRERDGKNVIIKSLNRKHPAYRDIARISHEYQVVREMDVPGVIHVYALEKYADNVALIMEDFKAHTLASYLNHNKKITVDTFINIAVELTKIVGEIHKVNIIHKNINPFNILWNPSSGEIKIIGFEFSSKLSREKQDINSYTKMEGSLPYISPEQTGRMNRELDYRTDFYSLGATFYELLTGQHLFQADDIMSWVHSHIARMPSDPRQLNIDIPNTVVEIIFKLIAKNAEDRYQSSYGLLKDLKKCQKEWEDKKEIEGFELGRWDVPEKLQIPQKLYGREDEIQRLMETFESVSEGKAGFFLVTGYPGVGKSAIINEIHKPIVRQKGYFINGKFDQFHQNMPYSAISQAFGNLVYQLLAEPEDRIKRWKDALTAAFGTNGQIIMDIIPELEKLVGKQPPVPELNSTELQNRFIITFHNFIKVFANKENPLVIFLDDLQWSDLPTLNLIKSLLSSTEFSSLLIIGAYRNNEVKQGHPLLLTIEEVEKVTHIQKLHLEPLKEITLNQITAETLQCSLEHSKLLANILYQKTEGNPFFFNELLLRFYQDGSISFSNDQGLWKWDMEKISQAKINENVVEFIIEYLRKLPPHIQYLLQLAACIGNTFDLNTLSMIYDQSFHKTSRHLWEALDKGLIVPLNDEYKLVQTEQSAGDSPGFDTKSDSRILFKFRHDRVQQAAYELIGKDEKQQVHLSIGRLMQQHMSAAKQDEKIIEIIYQLNEGRRLIKDKEEIENLALLNLKAGSKAKDSVAHQAALKYATIGLELLSDNSWENHYEITLALSKVYAECAYLTGKFEEAERRIKIILGRVKTTFEKADVYEVLVRQYTVIGKTEEAIKAGIEGLSLLGIIISGKPNQFLVLVEMMLVKWNLGKRKITDIIHAPLLSEPEKKLAAKLLMEIGAPAYITGNDNLFALVITKLTNLSLRHGNSSESAFVYVCYGMILGITFGASKTGYEFGKLGMVLKERFRDIKLSCRIVFVYAAFIHHWNEHWRTLSPLLKKGIDAGYQSGDLFYLCYCVNHSFIWDPGIDLETMDRHVKKHLSIVKASKYQDAVDGIEPFQHMYRNFRGLTKGLYSLDGDEFNETECLARMTERNNYSGIAAYHILKSDIYLFYGDHLSAYNHITEADKTIHSLIGLPFTVRFCFIAFMTFAACYPEVGFVQQRKIFRRMKKEYKKMKKWSENFQDNYFHLQLIMEAQFYGIADKPHHATSLYHRAAVVAQNNGFIRDEALAYELLSKCWLINGNQDVAKLYMEKACNGYQQWGAVAKVGHLKEKYPQLISWEINLSAINSPEDAATSPANSDDDSVQIESGLSSILDFKTITKATQAMSKEIDLEKVLKRIMNSIIENAGAQRGFLILESKDELRIEASVDTGMNNIIVLKSIPINETGMLSEGIVRFVRRSGRDVILHNAPEEGQFTEDVYIRKKKPKSILCTPIRYKDRILGVLYLENNLINSAFSYERIKVLHILLPQAAISIDNARLFNEHKEAELEIRELNKTLEQKVIERTAQLERANKELVKRERFAMLGKITATVSHELRNPLGVIRSSAFFLKKILPNTDQKIDKHIDRINGQIDQCDFIIKDLVEYTQGRAPVPVPGDINSVIKVVVSQILENEETDILVKFELEFDDTEVCYDNEKIQLVLKKIIRNSITAIMTRQEKLKETQYEPIVKVKTSSVKEGIKVTIEDNGTGMEADTLKQVFEPLFTTKTQGSSGLGLTIVKKIIEEHSGTITIESVPQQGTVVSFVIPLSI